MSQPLPISGYVLAGGRSSRMGRDKGMLDLGGKPLIAHVTAKLSRVCAEVCILGCNPALAAYAPLVADLHLNCGPLGGIEAALAHSARDWILIYAVDMPFLPAGVLYDWALAVTSGAQRVAMFSVEGHRQPAVCLLHKQIAPSISAAVALGEFKLAAVLEAAADVLALQQHRPLADLLGLTPASESSYEAGSLWFTNLNRIEDLALAETNLSALEP